MSLTVQMQRTARKEELPAGPLWREGARKVGPGASIHQSSGDANIPSKLALGVITESQKLC